MNKLIGLILLLAIASAFPTLTLALLVVGFILRCIINLFEKIGKGISNSAPLKVRKFNEAYMKAEKTFVDKVKNDVAKFNQILSETKDPILKEFLETVIDNYYSDALIGKIEDMVAHRMFGISPSERWKLSEQSLREYKILCDSRYSELDVYQIKNHPVPISNNDISIDMYDSMVTSWSLMCGDDGDVLSDKKWSEPKASLKNKCYFHTSSSPFGIPFISYDENNEIYILPFYFLHICHDESQWKFDVIYFEDVDITITSKGQEAVLTFMPFNVNLVVEIRHKAEYFYNSFMKIKDRKEEEKAKAEGRKPRKRQLLAQKELSSLIGLKEAKKEVRSLIDFVKIQAARKEKGLKTLDLSYHCVFTGHPGTGKTTVARIVATMYRELGILKSGHLIETDRSGLVAEYVGQTAVKTNKIIDSALDGVLFIDEAYSLVQGGSEDYGHEAVATLLKRMEDDRERLVVILAGYTGEMKRFIESNPGLQSRFNRYIHFEDYSAEELKKIFLRNLEKNQYTISDEASEKLDVVLEKAVVQKTRSFGNARYVRNLFEKTLQNQASRLAAAEDTSIESLTMIKAEDIKEILLG